MAFKKFNSSSTRQSANGGCGLVAFGIFWTLFSSIFLVVGIWMTVTEISRSGWPTAPCQIERFEIVESRNAESPFSIQTRYSYQWEGKTYSSTKAWDSDQGEDDYIDLTDELELYRTNQIKECSVNPEDPAEAVLFATSSSLWGGLIFAAVGALFVAIGVGLTIAGRRSKRAEKEALSSKATSDIEGGKAIIIPFFGVFACAGLGLLIFMVLPMWQKYFSAQNWKQTPATVIWSQVRVHDGDDGDTYSADIFYRYQFDGETYKSNTVGLMGGSSSGRKAKQEKVNAHPPGKEITCYVNPENPHQTLLYRDMGWWAAFTLFPLPFAGFGLGGLWFTLNKRKKAARATSSTSPYRKSTNQKDYTSSFSSSQSHEKFSPGKKRIFKAIGLLAVAAFWNGIVSVIYFNADDAPSWFLAIFAVIGAAIFLGFIYHLLACFNPAPQLTLVPGEIEIGSVALLKWSVKSRAHKLNHFAIYLVGEEEAKYRRGTNTVTDTEIFYEQALIDTKSEREISSGTAEIELPLDTVPSWESSNNAIKWSIRVRGDIPLWPDISDNYDITVITPNNHE